MENNNLKSEFSWATFLIVTGISFLIFCFVLRVLNDDYPRIFLWIGISGLAMGIITAIGSFFTNKK